MTMIKDLQTIKELCAVLLAVLPIWKKSGLYDDSEALQFVQDAANRYYDELRPLLMRHRAPLMLENVTLPECIYSRIDDLYAGLSSLYCRL